MNYTPQNAGRDLAVAILVGVWRLFIGALKFIRQLFIKPLNKMKVLLFALLAVSLSANCQKLDEKKYDRFDSLQKIKTKSETLYGKILARDYLSANCAWTKFMNLKNEPAYTSVLIGFKTNSVTSIEESSSEIKIEFSDNSISTYPYKGNYNLLTSQDYGVFTLNIEPSDPLFTKAIKTVRVKTRNQVYEYAIKEKASEIIKNSLALITDEVKKGF